MFYFKKYFLTTLLFFCYIFSEEISEKKEQKNTINELKDTKTKKTKIKAYALVWQSKEGSLEYAAKDKSIQPSSTETRQKIEIVIPDFGWRPGLKVELSHIFSHDNWDALANWTFYRGEFTHVKKHPNVELEPEYNGIIPYYYYNFLSNPLSPPPKYEHSTADWTLYFNSIDLEMGKSFSIREKLSIRLLSGLRGSWINQDYKVYYTDGNRISNSQDDITLLKSTIHFKNDSLGFGPRIGIETYCHLKWGLRLLATSSISTLLTKFEVKQDQDDLVYDNNLSENREFKLLLKDRFFAIKPNIQIILGFDWKHNFRKILLNISVAYEMQYFFGQNQIKRLIEKKALYSNRGDLQLQGLTAGIGIGF